jgi:hypothetical protein
MIGSARQFLVLPALVLVSLVTGPLFAQEAVPLSPPPMQTAPALRPINVTGGQFPPPPMTLQGLDIRRFQFTIDPKTPLSELLPPAPKEPSSIKPITGDDLTRVPEVCFQAVSDQRPAQPGTVQQTAFQIAKINHLNGMKADGFLESLRAQRSDLAGLPFAMGDACRTKGDRSKQFAAAVATVRRALNPRAASGSAGNVVLIAAETAPIPVTHTPASNGSTAATTARLVGEASENFIVADFGDQNHARNFWEQYRIACDKEDKAITSANPVKQEHAEVSRIAALMQVLAPESPNLRLGLVKYLAGVTRVEATRALAKMAVFSVEEEVRQAAIQALKVRRERDYTDILVQGLHYPWPEVARRAAKAVVELDRTDLLPQLVDLLDRPDPRLPVTTEVNGSKTVTVRELVRVNHHRSCLLCHAPGNTGKVGTDTLTAAVPLPEEPLADPSNGYNASSPDLLVRVDVTYLRQDFSLRQAVADAAPWPEMQRFDFLVRSRELTDTEAATYRETFARAEPGRPSPYQRAALAALREMTGKDTEPTAAGWRRLLDLPAKQMTAVP